MSWMESRAGRASGEPAHVTRTGTCAAAGAARRQRSTSGPERHGTGETRTSTVVGLPLVMTGFDVVLMKRSLPSTSMRACTA